ncbi:type II toxin-antitoxin system VapC family toxin [Candidatus Gottesmanbacteria bacterium]|nr:type II toxin-antitoxin system VapC family toxin [Candidatus Gottesmanbacteria bacterium]
MIVIDASVALKWFHKEKDSELANLILSNQQKGDISIAAPDLLLVEVANAIATKSAISTAGLAHSLRKLRKMDIRFYRMEQEIVFAAAREAKKYKTSVYDMLYAQFARMLGTELITADEQFVRKTKFAHVKLLSAYA